MDSISKILSAFLEHCSPAADLGGWSAPQTDSDVYRGPDHPIASLARLLEEFTERELIAAGVAQQSDEDAGLLPASGWSRPGSLLVVLRRAPRLEPFDVLTECGSFSGALPLYASLADSKTIDAIDAEHDFLLVAGSLEDLAVLRGAGLPVTLASGILPLDRAKLADLFRTRFLRRRPQGCVDLSGKLPSVDGDEGAADLDDADGLESDPLTARPEAGAAVQKAAEDVDAPPDLIFVAWSPCELLAEEPACLEPIGEALRAVGRHLNVNIDKFYEWRLTAQEFDTLRFCLELGESERVRDVLWQSIDANSTELIADGATTAAPPLQDFEGALENLRQTVIDFRRNHSHRSRLQTSLDDYLKAVERELLAPLRSQGLAYRSPLRRNLYVVAAEICGQLHYQSHWARTAAELLGRAALLGRKADSRQCGPEDVLRGASALAGLAARLLV